MVYISHVVLRRLSIPVALGAAATLLSAAPGEYIDAKACAGCHRQIAQDFARTGMGRSFFRPMPANTHEDFGTSGLPGEFYHDLSATYFSMVSRQGQYFQRRWEIGFDGSPTNIEELRIDYVLGSGNHARSYLHRTPRGTLIELPLGWYAEPQGRGHWGMSPGSDSDHPRTRRFVSYKCMFCHNAIPRIPKENETPGSDPVFAGDLPEGIDCQRCHGPGSNHVRVVTSRDRTQEDIRASIVNPARLAFDRRIEICMQCHLETTSGPIPSSIVRFDRGPFSFVPGEALGAFMLTFDHAPRTGHDAKFEAVSSVYRLRQSKCFLQSQGRLECDTCHNPHRVLRGEEAVTHYADVCARCHSGAVAALIASGRHTSSTNCVSCHMPKRRAEDTPGMIMTDHLIQRGPPAANLTVAFREKPPEQYRGEIAAYYPSPMPASPANALYLAVAQVGLSNNSDAGLPALAREMAAQKPAEAEWYLILGDAWLRAGNTQEAVAAYREAAKLAPKSPRPLRQLADALHSRDIFQQAIAIAPGDPLTWYRYGLLELASGDSGGAAGKIRRAIELDPSLPNQSRSLAEALAKGGQSDAALAACREALRTDPYDDGAWDLTGRMLAEKLQWPEAFYDFEKALRLRPGYATYLYDFALALVRADRIEEALPRAEAAVQAGPESADAYELLGGLYTIKRRWPEAIRSYSRAVQLRPGSAAIHLRLGNVLAAHGDTASAVEHLREAARSTDATIAKQAADALRRIGAAK